MKITIFSSKPDDESFLRAADFEQGRDCPNLIDPG